MRFASKETLSNQGDSREHECDDSLCAIVAQFLSDALSPSQTFLVRLENKRELKESQERFNRASDEETSGDSFGSTTPPNERTFSRNTRQSTEVAPVSNRKKPGGNSSCFDVKLDKIGVMSGLGCNGG